MKFASGELRLALDADGQPELQYSKDGYDWALFTFRDGQFYREPDIPNNSGLILDKYGRIVEAPE